MTETDWLVDRFEERRPRLRAAAYRRRGGGVGFATAMCYSCCRFAPGDRPGDVATGADRCAAAKVGRSSRPRLHVTATSPEAWATRTIVTTWNDFTEHAESRRRMLQIHCTTAENPFARIAAAAEAARVHAGRRFLLPASDRVWSASGSAKPG